MLCRHAYHAPPPKKKQDKTKQSKTSKGVVGSFGRRKEGEKKKGVVVGVGEGKE